MSATTHGPFQLADWFKGTQTLLSRLEYKLDICLFLLHNCDTDNFISNEQVLFVNSLISTLLRVVDL